MTGRFPLSVVMHKSRTILSGQKQEGQCNKAIIHCGYLKSERNKTKTQNR